jgi:hypothetical protein
MEILTGAGLLSHMETPIVSVSFIALVIEDRVRDERFSQRFNPDATASAMIEWLVDKYGLPRYSLSGGPIHYDLIRSLTNQALPLDQTLRQIGIQEGEVLQLISPEARIIWKLIEKLKDEIKDHIKEKLEDLAKQKLEELADTLRKTHARDPEFQKLQARLQKATGCRCSTLSLALGGGAVILGAAITLLIAAVASGWFNLSTPAPPAPQPEPLNEQSPLPPEPSQQPTEPPEYVPPIPPEPPLSSGSIQVTLRWEGRADLDLYVSRGEDEVVFFGNPISVSEGRLEFDGNSCDGQTAPVENIFWDWEKAPEGHYLVEIEYPYSCTDESVEWEVTIMLDGDVFWRESGIIAPGDHLYMTEFDYLR